MPLERQEDSVEINIKKLEKEQLHTEGKTKKLFTTTHPDYFFMEFKNEVCPMDAKKTTKVRGKAQINNEVSSYIFQFLDSYHIPTHYIGKHDDKSMVVRALDMIPIHVVVRNMAAGAFAKNFKLEEGQILPAPIIEFYYKNDKMGNPMVNEYHLYAFGSSNQDEVRIVQRLSAKINAVMKNFFERRNLQLVEFKLEFGRSKGKIFLGDEITLDTCRVWDINTNRKFEKEIAHSRDNEINRIYTEVRQRLVHPKTRDEKVNVMEY
jgi:phosphoribosylaminoimidazole-succinocarboxamide synthase